MAITAYPEKPAHREPFFRQQCTYCQHWIDFAPGDIKVSTVGSGEQIRSVPCPNCQTKVQIKNATHNRKTAHE